jgi:hypothetical protein
MALTQHLSEHGTTVFNFYNVIGQDEKGIRDAPGLTVGPEVLMANIELLLNGGAEPVSLDQIIDGYTPANSFHLMACDGYKLPNRFMSEVNNLDLPMSFSIAAGLVGQNTPSWTNKIEIALQETLEKTGGKGVEFLLSNIGLDQKFAFADIQGGIALRNQLKDALPAGMDGDQFVQQICSSLTDVTGHKIEPTLISNSAFDSKMTWPEIKRLVGDGHELVSHGAKHTQKFTDMFDADIQADIIDAQNTFQVATGVRPSILTYPEGAYDERVIAAIR